MPFKHKGKGPIPEERNWDNEAEKRQTQAENPGYFDKRGPFTKEQQKEHVERTHKNVRD